MTSRGCAAAQSLSSLTTRIACQSTVANRPPLRAPQRMTRLQRLVASVAGAPRSLARLVARASSSSSSTARPEEIPTANLHRSNAQELVSAVPVIEVDGHVALCDGGACARDAPRWVALGRRAGRGSVLLARARGSAPAAAPPSGARDSAPAGARAPRAHAQPPSMQAAARRATPSSSSSSTSARASRPPRASTAGCATRCTTTRGGRGGRHARRAPRCSCVPCLS